MTEFKAEIRMLIEKVQYAADALDNEGPDPHEALVSAVNHLKNAVETPWDKIWETRFESMNSVCKRMAMEMGLLEAIVARNGDAVTAGELAKETSQDEQMISRILRVLTSSDMIAEQGDRIYAANETTEVLNSITGRTEEKYFFDFLFPIGANIVNAIKWGGVHQFPEGDQKSPFEVTFGLPIFDYFKHNQEAKLVFENLVSGRREGVTLQWYEIYPVISELFGSFQSTTTDRIDSVFLVNVSGGTGHDLLSFANAHLDVPGRLILEDLPITFANFEKEHGFTLSDAGIELQHYDMFAAQPIEGAQAYFMRDVCHDWPDSACKTFLGNIATAMTKGYSKLLLNDYVVEDANANRRSAASDMLMMLVLSRAQRTRKQWTELLGSVGLEIVKIWPGADGQQSVIEAMLIE